MLVRVKNSINELVDSAMSTYKLATILTKQRDSKTHISIDRPHVSIEEFPSDFTFHMNKYIGKAIILDETGVYDGFTFSSWMYDVLCTETNMDYRVLDENDIIQEDDEYSSYSYIGKREKGKICWTTVRSSIGSHINYFNKCDVVRRLRSLDKTTTKTEPSNVTTETTSDSEYEPFKDFLSIPRNAIFRPKDDKHNRVRYTTAVGESFTKSSGNGSYILFPGLANTYTPKQILSLFEMTIDNGKTWIPAGSKIKIPFKSFDREQFEASFEDINKFKADDDCTIETVSEIIREFIDLRTINVKIDKFVFARDLAGAIANRFNTTYEKNKIRRIGGNSDE